MWFSQQETLIGALGLGVAVILSVLVFMFLDVKDGMRGRESFTGNFFNFIVRTAGMRFWHTRAFLILLALFVVMVVAIVIVSLKIMIFPA
jgi:hypothetical protein